MGGGGLTVRDVCDISYGVLRDRLERQVLASMQVYAAYEASGRYEMRGEMPSLDESVEEFDEALDAPFTTGRKSADRELLELMGVA